MGACRSLVRYVKLLSILFNSLFTFNSNGASLELDFNACERIEEYLQVEQEAPLVIEDKRPPAYWPSSTGALEVEDLVVQYSPDLPPALDHVSFSVKPGAKVGVVSDTHFFRHLFSR